jgi:hypothetical protein
MRMTKDRERNQQFELIKISFINSGCIFKNPSTYLSPPQYTKETQGIKYIKLKENSKINNHSN